MLRKHLLLISFFLVLSSIVNAQDKPFLRMDVFDLQWVQDPQISPDGNQIVYVRRGMDIMKDRRTASLWVTNADGTYHQKLTNRTESESNPKWSPSGDRIAFTSSEEDHVLPWLEKSYGENQTVYSDQSLQLVKPFSCLVHVTFVVFNGGLQGQ